MYAYHFHSSCGPLLALDLKGTLIDGAAEIRAHAASVALDVLDLYGNTDPSGWVMTIQDQDGYQVDTTSFSELLLVRPAALPGRIYA